MPTFIYQKKNGRKPIDVEAKSSFFIINHKVKELFDTIDSAAFDFIQASIIFEDGIISTDYWLCDVVRIVDALDEKRSDIRILPFDPKIYCPFGSGKLIFDDRVEANYHVFRMAYSERQVICDTLMRNACKDTKIKGLNFRETSR